MTPIPARGGVELTGDTQTVGGAQALRIERPPMAPGVRVGRYVVVRHLATGGMGSLYKAYDPQLDRTVALKLVNIDGEGTDNLRERLLREARALAKLAHPNVVTVFEADVFGGELFIAMELIEGTTIRAWLERAPPPSRREILDAFLAAGEGVAAAHRAGLVHRDFKPDNVLVGVDGRVRVVDFGLARSYFDGGEPAGPPARMGAAPPSDPGQEAERTDVDRAERTDVDRAGALDVTTLDRPAPRTSEDSKPDSLSSPLTEAGSRPGTPRYMAPEQHLDLAATDKSDQFSFCLCLYTALYGAYPFAAKRLGEIFAAVTSGEVAAPPPNSTVPRWLRAVLLRGLSREPAERYPSMDALLAALRADPTARRRRWIATAAVAVVAAGLASLVGYAIQRPRAACDAAGREIDAVWNPSRRAELSAAFARSGASYAGAVLAGVQTELDAYAQDWHGAAQRTCRAHVDGRLTPDASEAASRCLSDRLGELRAFTGELASADTKTVASAQNVALALPSPAACEATDRMLGFAPPPRDPAVRARVEALERRRVEAEKRADLGHLDVARVELEALLPEAEATGHGPLVTRVLYALGRAYSRAYDYERADTTLTRCIYDADEARQDSVRARAWIERVRLAYSQAHYVEALADAEQAGAVVERVGDDELRVELLWQHAWALSFAGRSAEAVAAGQRGLSLAGRTFGRQEHPLVAELWSVVSASEVDLGKLDDAERDGRRALAIASALYVEDNDRRARIAENLTAVLDAEGKYEEAVALEEYALRAARALGGEDDPNTAIVRQNLGDLLLDANRPREAIPLLEASRAALDRDPSQHDAVFAAYMLTALGRAYVADGQAARALPFLERALRLARDKKLDPDVTGESQYRLAVALVATGGDASRALALAKSGLAAMQTVPRLRKLTDEAGAWIAAHGSPSRPVLPP